VRAIRAAGIQVADELLLRLRYGYAAIIMEHSSALFDKDETKHNVATLN
jgi:hypothetical protein